MALEIQKGRSKWWYGRVTVNGADVVKNLGVQIKGVPPRTLRDLGDAVFERTRAKAQAALEKLQLDLKAKNSAEELVQTIHELRTGARVTSILLTDIGQKWKALPRRRPLSPRYIKQAESWIKRFVEFVQRSNPAIKEMAQVQSSMARAFLRGEEKRGVTAKTYNNTVIFLRSLFHSLRRDAGLAENPFDGIPTRDGETVFRRPFTVEELEVIVEKAKADDLIYPLIITGMCTAMRRGDCCTLLRESVDLKSGFINVKTSKTGETVQIPVFPLLQPILAKAFKAASPHPSPYLFPSLEARYRANPDFLTDRVRQVMRAAGFVDPEDAETEEEKQNARGQVHQTRTSGLRKASVRDFHSFRVTWVTLALSAGVPLEVVQKVTGHRTAGIVMKHYFQPGREDFRRTLAGKMPSLLVGGAPKHEPPSLKELLAELKTMTAKNWESVREAMVAKLEPAVPELPAAAEPKVDAVP